MPLTSAKYLLRTDASEAAQALIAYCAEDGRVCPIPPRWTALWELLPNRRRTHLGWEPPAPLILTAWHSTSDLEKVLRLTTHIEWADRNGALEPVSAFLRKLRDEDWFHQGEPMPRRRS